LLKVVCNSSPLIHLAKIKMLEMLKNFFGEILIPEAVYRECVREGGEREDAKEIENAGWVRVMKIKDKELKKALNVALDEGESESIVLALEQSADLILLDDYEAREFARTYGLSITGTVGILMKAKKEGKIASLEEELEKLRESGFWLSNKLYTKVLQEENNENALS
jgi:predicted nucleic acid-binding protein